ncbi:MAG: hypothetical protein FJ100_21975 [Deltaproteobacteria bacterium]|nr:hypothetical protein [Deltaproteobacteria bacterium]
MRNFKPMRGRSGLGAALWTVAIALSCESAAPDPVAVVDQKAKNVPAAPSADKGMQFVGPKLTIAAGEEKMLCWVPNWTPDRG